MRSAPSKCENPPRARRRGSQNVGVLDGKLDSSDLAQVGHRAPTRGIGVRENVADRRWRAARSHVGHSKCKGAIFWILFPDAYGLWGDELFGAFQSRRTAVFASGDRAWQLNEMTARFGRATPDGRRLDDSFAEPS